MIATPHSKTRLRAGAAALLAALLLAGCYESKQVITLNPDGSGKVELEATFPAQAINLIGQESDPAGESHQAARSLVKESKGIEAWEGVSFETTDDGDTRFKGTAYFRDVGRLEFHNLSNTRLQLKRAEDGLTVRVQMGEEKEAKPAGDVVLSDEEIAAEVAKQRAEYQKVAPMMASMLGTMKEDILLHLPGKVADRVNLAPVDERSVRYTLEGSRLLQAMGDMLADDAFMEEQVRTGANFAQDGPADRNILNEKVFGKADELRVRVGGPLEPRFDYKAEVTRVLGTREEWQTVLGVVPARPVELSNGKGLTSVEVVGVRLVYASDQETGIRPFNHEAGYVLSVVGRFDGAVNSVEEGLLEKAMAAGGTDLLPGRDWDRRIRFPRLSKDKTAVLFELALKEPGPGVSGLQEVSGSLTYFVANETQRVDLGIETFEANAKGTVHGAEIESIEENKWQPGGEALTLKVQLPKESIKAVQFEDADGRPLEFNSTSTIISGGTTSYTYSYQEKFPEKGRVFVEIYRDQQKYKTPFRLSNLDLLGKPL